MTSKLIHDSPTETSISMTDPNPILRDTKKSGVSIKSIAVIKPPSHPTYDLKGVIKLLLAEDAADLGS